MVIILLSTKMFLCQIYKDTYILWYRSGEGDFFRNMNSPCGCFSSLISSLENFHVVFEPKNWQALQWLSNEWRIEMRFPLKKKSKKQL